uniref:At1g61320/AtMIF1 LRR domain-containing protein n=1 Tax=Leersia perrieri TaxID=77586 RepID=A0A0D9XSK2_9ORYZ
MVPVEMQPTPMRNGPIASATGINNSPYQCGDDSHCAGIVESKVQLPEDILHHIHAFMPMQDAARAACASRCFLRSWRFYPKLNLNVNTLCIEKDARSEDEITRDFISRVDPIMLNHAGTGVKMFKLFTYPCSSLHPSYVDRWLQIAVAPGIKEFGLKIYSDSKMDYDFPCSLINMTKLIQNLLLITLQIELPAIRHDSILEDLNGGSFHPRVISEYHHDNLKSMMITGFCSAKSMINLTYHILENTSSLEYLTLDTTRGYDRRYEKIDKCLAMSREAILEAEKALRAIRIYVEGRVPSSVNLKVIEPCSKCHTNSS